MTQGKLGRNDKCGCGRGKKFKQSISAARHDSSATPAAGQVWSAEHGHYH